MSIADAKLKQAREEIEAVLDYNGDTEAQRRDLAATANMVRQVAMILGESAIGFLELARVVDEAIGADHGPTQYQPDPPRGAH